MGCRKLIGLPCLVALSLLLSSAASISWVGGITGGDWEVGSNWDLGVPPGPNDNVTISGSTVVSIFSKVEAFSVTLKDATLILRPGTQLQLNAANGRFEIGGTLALLPGSSLITQHLVKAPMATFIKMILRTADLYVLASACDLGVILLYSYGRSSIHVGGPYANGVPSSGNGHPSTGVEGGWNWQGTISIIASASAQNCLENATLTFYGNLTAVAPFRPSQLNTYISAFYPCTLGQMRVQSGSTPGGFAAINGVNVQVFYTPPFISSPPPLPVLTAERFLPGTISIATKDASCSSSEQDPVSWPYKTDAGATTGSTTGYSGTGPSCSYSNANGIIILGSTCTTTTDPQCAPGFRGPNCDIPMCPADCSAKGSCANANGVPVCVCNNGWTGTDCSVPQCINDCSGNHGNCIPATPQPVCVCNTGWSDVDCSVPSCSCGANKYCEGALNPPQCKCNTGWGGANCDIPIANQFCPGDCSSFGSCNVSTGLCACDLDQGGLDCSVALCVNDCSLRGTCLADHTCQCDTGFSGFDCSNGTCSSCVNGACLTTANPPVCVCLPGWVGNACTDRLGIAPPPSPKSTQKHFRIILGAVLGGVLGAAVIITLVLLAIKKGMFKSVYNTRDDEGWIIR